MTFRAMTFRAKTVIGIALIEIVLLMILVISSMSFLADSNEKQLIQRADATKIMFAKATQDAVLSMDLATLDDLTNEIVVLEDVLYVKVIRNDKVLACSGDKSLLDRTPTFDKGLDTIDDGIFDTRVNIEVDGTVYGHIDMGFGTSSIDNLLASAQKSIVAIASLEVFLVAVFSLVLGTYLTRNLTKLTEAAHNVAENGPGYQIKMEQKDELAEVANAFDKMSRSLQENYGELKLARSEAEQASESKSRFLASMSHEIRTPMNGVLGLLSLLEETKLDKEQMKLLHTATESGELLLSIINDILDFSRMDANTLILEHKPFILNSCMIDIVDSFNALANKKNIALVCSVDNTKPISVIGDVNRFRQVVLNLLGNAFKFTSEGLISVQLQTEVQDQNKIQVTCSVTDTGIGIETNALDYLFDEFTMVDQSYSRSRDGSGLGLAISQRLAEMMDGGITAKSTLNQGSTFTFTSYLKLSDEEEKSDKTSKTSPVLSEAIRKCKILVAEDNKANQLVIQNMFLHVGMDIDIAENGNQAVEMVLNGTYDFVFMDISMPEKDGIEACSDIRNLESSLKSSVPIVALTAHALSGDKEKFMKAGMDDYLSKPVRMFQLIEMLNRYLDPERLSMDETGMGSSGNDNNEVAMMPNQQQRSTSVMTQEQGNLTDMDTSNMDTTNEAALQSNINLHSPEDSVASEGLDSELINQYVDESILIQMIEDTSAEVIPLLIEHYVEECHVRLEKIYAAMDAQDIDSLEFETHTLGSSSLALGNRKLSTLARAIEKQCLQNNSEEAFKLCAGIEELANASIKALKLRSALGFESHA
ncbi:HAMP domain-containing hybrid sensor histidine kinase/response regulator [Vibrio genomosp. F6]|uniref:HAMP domain-containing hybrid sensor histidine kinase/response regulator n=1 Tax=Vibrio genomosp. F6 TaxID=723172 RepID=UPI001F118322|nr:response regulator [Vibrio genomosp. F6]